MPRHPLQSEAAQRRVGVAASIAIHLLLLLLFVFITAWRAPNPPLPEYGIEVRLGVEDAGSGEALPDALANLAEPPLSTTSEAEVANSFSESEAVVGEPLLSRDPALAMTTEGEMSLPASPREQSASESKKKEVRKPATPNQTQYNSSQPSTEATNAGLGRDGTQTQLGRQGNPSGEVDAKALYGNPSGGAGLELAGWNWDRVPRPKIPDDEPGGRIVFEVKVDQSGDIIAYSVLERSVSVEAERACREAISSLTFTKKSAAAVPKISVGKITFIVRSR